MMRNLEKKTGGKQISKQGLGMGNADNKGKISTLYTTHKFIAEMTQRGYRNFRQVEKFTIGTNEKALGGSPEQNSTTFKEKVNIEQLKCSNGPIYKLHFIQTNFANIF